jgi:hypothetical protein
VEEPILADFPPMERVHAAFVVMSDSLGYDIHIDEKTPEEW